MTKARTKAQKRRGRPRKEDVEREPVVMLDRLDRYSRRGAR